MHCAVEDIVGDYNAFVAELLDEREKGTSSREHVPCRLPIRQWHWVFCQKGSYKFSSGVGCSEEGNLHKQFI